MRKAFVKPSEMPQVRCDSLSLSHAKFIYAALKSSKGGIIFRVESCFNGRRFEYVAIRILYSVAMLGSAFTLVPLIYVYEARYLARHTVVDGRALEFTGTVAQSYAKHLWWLFLSVVTLFAYLPFVYGARNKWRISRTEVSDGLVRAGSGLKRDLTDLAVMNVFAFIIKWATLGLLRTPSEMLKIRFTMTHTVYSGEKVKFSGGGIRRLYKSGVLAAILRVLSLGISSIFEDYELEKWRAENTRLLTCEEAENDKLWNALGVLIKHKYVVIASVISLLALSVIAVALTLIFAL